MKRFGVGLIAALLLWTLPLPLVFAEEPRSVEIKIISPNRIDSSRGPCRVLKAVPYYFPTNGASLNMATVTMTCDHGCSRGSIKLIATLADGTRKEKKAEDVAIQPGEQITGNFSFAVNSPPIAEVTCERY